MSEIAINAYLKELEKLRHYGGSANESSIRAAFQNLLTTYAKLIRKYRFADYQDKVIDLLRRVCTVSVKTMEIVKEMERSENTTKPEKNNI